MISVSGPAAARNCRESASGSGRRKQQQRDETQQNGFPRQHSWTPKAAHSAYPAGIRLPIHGSLDSIVKLFHRI